MATEIATLDVKETFSPDGMKRALELFKPPPPGLQSYGWGYVVGNPNKIVMLLNWDAVANHEAFMKSSIYTPFLERMMTFLTGPTGVSIYHTHLQPFPPIKLFEMGNIHIASLAKKPELSREKFEATRDELLNVVSKAPGFKCHFYGVKHEDDSVYIVLTGWDSVESHAASRSGIRAAMEDAVVLEQSSFTNVKPYV